MNEYADAKSMQASIDKFEAGGRGVDVTSIYRDDEECGPCATFENITSELAQLKALALKLMECARQRADFLYGSRPEKDNSAEVKYARSGFVPEAIEEIDAISRILHGALNELHRN